MASGSGARCCWCGSGFVRVGDHFWCVTDACRVRQSEHSIGTRVLVGDKIDFRYLYVPLPRQVEFDACKERFLLGGGAAGSTKSHSARYSMYRRALAFEDYEGLILRKTWPELEKHHFRLMEREAKVFQSVGIDAKFSVTNREMVFTVDGNRRIIEGGHMENKEDVDKYLSRERDEIVCDEGSTFPPMQLLELSTRARTSKRQFLEVGIRGLFRVFTNPGGASSSTLRDFFIDHEPDWEQFTPELREKYNAREWVYIPGNLEDNPYLPENYESDLTILAPWRYRQLRYNDWDVLAGQFFAEFDSKTHVQDLGDPGDTCSWFRSIDWGYVAPGDILWWACLPDQTYYIRYEHKYSHATIPEVASTIKHITEDAGISHVRYTVADPAMWQPNGTTGEAMNETFARNGVPLIRGHNDRVNGWQRVREMLRLREDQRPTIVIHPDCRYLIRTLAQAVSAKQDPEDVDTTIDDHPLDTLRYGAMSRPSPTRRTTTKNPKSFKAVQERMLKFQKEMTLR